MITLENRNFTLNFVQGRRVSAMLKEIHHHTVLKQSKKLQYTKCYPLSCFCKEKGLVIFSNAAIKIAANIPVERKKDREVDPLRYI
jgi:hypothetical protein